MLLLKNVWKEYPIKDNEPVQALKGVSLAFKDRGLTCILGPSGCGKTTLLNIIGGLDHYTSGDVIVNGCSTKDYRDRDWDSYRNREVGIVFQSYNLIPHLSILKNVELAMTLSGVRSREREERAKKALTLVGLLDQCEKKPNQLSGGQMQRVALARALVNTPNVILADEPTGALDSTTSVQVMELFKEISQKRLVIMVTHNESLAERYADRIIRLEDGKVVSDSIDDPEKSLREAEEEIGNILAKRPPEKKRNAFLRFFDDHFKRDRDHTSMNLQTALSISGRNLLAKRGKTIVTAIASSIGIIGVGLVLALSNGFTNYVDRMERETLSKFPMSIEKYGLNYASSSGDHLESYPEGDVVNVVEPSTSSLHTNRITKEYIQYLEGLNTEETTYAQYHYSYSIGMHVIGKGSSNLGVETYQAISTSSSSFVESMASSLMGSSSAWNELPASQEQILEQYDILAGEFPDEELQVAEGGVPDQEEFPETEFDSESGTFVPVYRNGFFFKDDVTMDEIVQQMQQMMQDDGESDLSTFLDMLDLPTAQEIQDHADELLLDSNVQAVLSKYQVSTLDLIQLLTKVLGEGSFTKEDLQSLFPDIASPSEQERVGNFLYDLIIAIRDSSLFAPYFHRQLNYYQSPANDSNRLKELYEGTDQGQRPQNISSILRPKSTTSIGLLGEGVYYPSSLTYQCFHDNASSSIAEEFGYDITHQLSFLGVPLCDTQNLIHLLMRFAFNLIVAWIIVRFCYYRKSQRKDYVLTFMLFSSAMFMLIFLMENVNLQIGLMLGLFAIFGVIRYRTETVPVREMTYLFVIIATSVINGLALNISYAELFAADVLVIGVLWLLESHLLLRHTSAKLVIYEKIDLIVPERRGEMIADLERRLGLKIDKVEVGHVDFLRDVAFVKVYYTLPEGEQNTIDNITKPNQFIQ